MLPDDHLYKDVPFEEQPVQDILMKGLNQDDFTAQSLSSPMMSSPRGINKMGGVGMASMLSDAPMVDELFRQLQVMLPPEYRSMKAPKRDRKGNWMDLGSKKQKIKFKVAQKNSDNRHSTFSTSQDRTYSVVDRETNKRLRSSGEYSFVGSVVPGGSKSNVEVFNSMFNKFTQTEITTFHLEELRYADVDLKKLQDEIKQRESLWLQMVYARQFNPSLKSSLNEDKWKSRIEGDWKAFLPQMGHEDASQYVLDVKTDQSWENMKRLARSIARADGRSTVKKRDLREARKLINTSLEELVEQKEAKKARGKVKKRQNNPRYSSVQQILQTTRATTEEVWDRLGGYGHFDNKKDLQGYLRWLRENNYIIKGPQGRYRWIH